MKIQMLCSLSAPGEFLCRGREYELSAKRSLELLNAKFAKPAMTKEKREKALKPTAETR